MLKGTLGREQALRLEPHCVISNNTGVPLQLMQYRSCNVVQRTRRDGGSPGGGGVMPQRPSSGALKMGLSMAASLAEAAPESSTTVDLPVGRFCPCDIAQAAQNCRLSISAPAL